MQQNSNAERQDIEEVNPVAHGAWQLDYSRHDYHKQQGVTSRLRVPGHGMYLVK